MGSNDPNATLVFMSAYVIYVLLGKIRTSHALRSRTLLLRNNDTAVDTIVSTAVSDLATAFNFDTMQRYPNKRCKLIFPVFISCLTIFDYLKIAIFKRTRTTSIFDTKQPSLTEKSAENEGLSPVTTR